MRHEHRRHLNFAEASKHVGKTAFTHMKRAIDAYVPEQIQHTLEGQLLSLTHKVLQTHGAAVLDTRISKATEITFNPNFDEPLKEAIAQGDIPILYSNHQGHADVISTAKVAGRVIDISNSVRHPDNKLKGIKLIVAQSLFTGDQGTHLKYIYDGITPYLERTYGLHTLGYTRKKDIERYGLPPDNIGFVRRLRKATDQENMGLAIYPEGGTDGGKQKVGGKPGEINGIVPVTEGSIGAIVLDLHRRGRTTVLVPFGTNGAYKLMDSDKKMFTTTFFKAVAGLPIETAIEVNVGIPTRSTDIIKLLESSGIPVTVDTLNTVFMSDVATLLPPPAQGVFKF